VALCVACGANSQRRAIQHARLSILGAGEAVEAVDKAVNDQYGNAPLIDKEAYCIFKRSSLILEQAKAAVFAAAEAVRVWEIALLNYQARKADKDPTVDAAWESVLDAKGTWLDMSIQIVGIVDAVIDSLGLYGVKMPSTLDYFWGLVSKLGPYHGDPPSWDWSSLKNSVCYPQEVTP
jgi:hypothetical protein